MPGLEESLFSLELVIEKVYIPHVTCRFPAVAFRLLDFPTILISHVDTDLAKTIKNKITRDPYYTTPDQFAELKDEHGNFMIRKGKSCLFKIPVETLKMHLTNTPLYVMVIDTFPDNPKLIGNSTVPLNSLMDNICVDIARLGTTVPSVQGDKGLFKIYSLMGKEIGYFVLGFRLLCLGPGLIPHLPEAALSKQIPTKQTEIQGEDRNDNKVIHVAEATPSKAYRLTKQAAETSEQLNDTREMGSMTDVEKHDVILQTMELNDKAVHVAISDVESKKDKYKSVTTSTQTEKHKKAKQKLNERQRKIEHAEEDDDADIIANDIVCPPPMFYNSRSSPKVKMQKYLHYDFSDSDDLTVEDLESVDEQGDNKGTEYVIKRQKDSPRHTQHSGQKFARSSEGTRQVFGKNVNTSRQTSSGSSPGMFPVLTALLNELTGIQSAPFLESVARLTQGQQQPVQTNVRSRPPATGPRPASQRIIELSQPRQPLVRDGIVRREADALQTRDEDILKMYDRGRRTYRQCAKPQPGVPKNKGWLRQIPEGSVKKSQLIFRLTHTERLRLAKTNPDWLKAIEKEELEMMKKKREQETKKAAAVESDVDLNATNLSDTLTEVRRLAQKELAKGDGTLNTTKDISTAYSDLNASLESDRQAGSPSRGKRWLSRYGRMSPSPRHRSHSPKHRLHRSPKSRSQSRFSHDKANKKRAGFSGENDEVSQRSDQKSIEVHLPSAQMDDDDEGSDMTLDDRDAISEDGRGEDDNKLSRFTRGEESFPDSIHGQPDGPLSDPRDEDQPLESTRLSTNVSRTLKGSSEYGTHQFMSTDEPELQDLMSEDEDRSEAMDSGRHGRLSGAVVSASIASSIHKFPVVNPVASEQSPVPATRRSTVKLDLGPSRELTPQPDTPRSQGSSMKPTPRPRRPVKLGRESIHTDSISSYQPSDPDNAVISLSSDMNYSDDFHPAGSDLDESLTDISSPDFLNPRLIPSTKLGYTIS